MIGAAEGMFGGGGLADRKWVNPYRRREIVINRGSIAAPTPLDYGALVNEITTKPDVSRFIPLNDINANLVPMFQMAIMANGGAIIPGLTYDVATSAPNVQIDASGTRPLLKLGGIKLQIDMKTLIQHINSPTATPALKKAFELAQKLAGNILDFQGTVSIDQLEFANPEHKGPGACRLEHVGLLSSLLDATAYSETLREGVREIAHGATGLKVSMVGLSGENAPNAALGIAMLIPHLVTHDRLQAGMQKQLNSMTAAGGPNVPERVIDEFGLRILGTKDNNPNAAGVQLVLRSHPK